ncbi:integrase arm-type DNA-binding domain-containing protein [Neisseria sp. 83E34]|uniref:tyrosine-type recombinase/integrase n=1 Tax=Neisseria sp. 83E34 TaxID=1692264 RepID=UPI0006CEA9E4|nr:integrase arm-type DNA-binding domain-containing protein [Neisseria sp. 83E34]KPN72401.1 integrase [Neisseria sp. 83E34]
MPLNDRQIKNAKPAAKPYKLADGKGMFLQVTPAGGKLWRLKYRIDGKEKLLSIGKYPAVSLSEAREAAENARRLIAIGQDPSAVKQQAKQERQAALLNTFEAITRRWHSENLHRWKPDNAARILNHFAKDVFPHIGGQQIDGIAVSDVKGVIERIAARNATATAEKIRQWIAAVYGYAAMLEITDRNPAAPLRGFLAKAETHHLPALPREELAEFYRRLILADIDPQNRIAVMLVMLVFVRSTELRGGQWHEIDWQAKTWTIPAERMKLPRAHVIPLSDWTLELLQELHGHTGQTPYLFPSRTKTTGFISEATLNRIIERLGYKGTATPHGFRSLASSVLNEQDFNPDAIERQLAHVPKDKIRAAYNRAEYWLHRVEMMQWYSDYLRERYNQARAMIEADS